MYLTYIWHTIPYHTLTLVLTEPQAAAADEKIATGPREMITPLLRDVCLWNEWLLSLFRFYFLLLIFEIISICNKNCTDTISTIPYLYSLTPIQSLTKQGYRLVGSHSGVKLCRWTKSMLRGRGGCYKHTFYGIESHRCMETTPSLACANKCVFCWR